MAHEPVGASGDEQLVGTGDDRDGDVAAQCLEGPPSKNESAAHDTQAYAKRNDAPRSGCLWSFRGRPYCYRNGHDPVEKHDESTALSARLRCRARLASTPETLPRLQYRPAYEDTRKQQRLYKTGARGARCRFVCVIRWRHRGELARGRSAGREGREWAEGNPGVVRTHGGRG